MTETTTSARSRRSLAVLAVVAVLVVPFGAAAGAQECRDPAGAWRTISPRFPEGPGAVVAYDIAPTSPDRFVAANERSLVPSADGGCSFGPATSLSDLGFGPSNRLVHVEFAPDDPNRVFALVEETSPVPRPHVLVSTDAGRRWREESSGLETTVGPPLDVAISANDGALYLLVGPAEADAGDTRVATSWSLYRSNAQEVFWLRQQEVLRSVAVGPVAPEPQEIRGLEADPFASEEVWLFGRSGLWRSRDGGQTLTRAHPRPVSALLLARFSGGGLTLAFDEQQPEVHAGGGYGDRFVTVRLPMIVHSAGAGRSADELVISSALGRVLHVPSLAGGRANELTPPGGAFDVRTALVSRDVIVYARAGARLLRRTLPGPLVIGDPDVPPLKDIDPGTFDSPSLVPEVRRVVLEPGERQDVPVRLFLPGSRRVDVFFLLDTSGSMGEELTGLRGALATIVSELNRAGIDAHFGIGQYRGPRGTCTADTEPITYRRVYDVAVPSNETREALYNLGAQGNCDESMLAALEQVATGSGIPSGDVPPGQNAHWREGALRVILHFADETFNEGGVNPSIEETGRVLADRAILQIGLAFQDETGLISGLNTDDPASGMRAVAQRTNALAPPEGADCDGDGAADLGAGDPLVCVVDPSRSQDAAVMAPAIVGLLAGLEDRGDVELTAKGPDGTVARVSPPVVGGVDFKRTQQIGFEVTLACGEQTLGETHPVALTATSRGVTLARAGVQVVCGIPAVVVAPPPDPPPAIAHVPPAPPQVVPQQHPQSQPQAHAQGAFAAQRQQEPQLAYGHVNRRPAPEPQVELAAREERYRMSAASEPAGVPPAATYLTGAAMAVAAVALARRRSRPELVHARASTVRRRTWR